MSRKFSIGLLIACFGMASVHPSFATDTIDISPVIVQPDWQQINQQMLEQDRINRDQELAIKGLIDDNQRLADTALARQQDATLDQINETMVKYRDYLLSRDRERIAANSQKISKYYDLIKLTEYVDDMKDASGIKAISQTVKLKSAEIDEKYRILTQLRDEMAALNEKLKAQAGGHETVIKTSPEQEAKIELLTQRLAQMDQRIAYYDDLLAQKDQQITQLKGQVGLLKSELANKITEEGDQTQKDKTIKEQEDQIVILKAQSQELSSKNEDLRSQADQLNKISEQFKGQASAYADLKTQVADLKNKIQEQADDLQAKDRSIRWLNQVLAVVKNKSTYYQLTSQQGQMTMQQVQEQVQRIKNDFADHFKDYDQFESAITSLKNQVSQLGAQLSAKQEQVNSLKSELDAKIIQSNGQNQIQQDLKNQLQDKEGQITKMKADILAILQDRANKEIYLHNASMQLDNRVQLAKQLIDLQGQEAALLDEKSNLEAVQSGNFEKHVKNLEDKIRTLMVKHQIQNVDMQDRLDELKNELDQKEQEVNSLKTTIENKIAEEKDQTVLSEQIQDLKSQIQSRDDQIAAMQTQIRSGQGAQAQVDDLKQQLAQEQSKVDLLKQELESKNAQFDKMTSMVDDYQKKLESRNDAYNEGLKQIAVLNSRLQEKEAQVVKIKRDMYELQELSMVRDRDSQAKDLSLSMIQERTTDEKIKGYQDQVDALQVTNGKQVAEVKDLKMQLALARQQLVGMPSSDEIEFLRTGLQKAALELQQKDQTILQMKSNTDEYTKEFKKQTMEFKSLTEQLSDAKEEIDQKDEDLKYKNLELLRFKAISLKTENDLKAQVKKLMSKNHENKVEALEAQLEKADQQIKDLQAKLDQLEMYSKNDTVQEKLKQALDKINEQGVLINTLAQKLQDAGKSVDLTHISDKE